MNSLLLYNCWAFNRIGCQRIFPVARVCPQGRVVLTSIRILIVNIMRIINYPIGTVQHMPRNLVFLHLLIVCYQVHNQESLVVYNYSNRNL